MEGINEKGVFACVKVIHNAQPFLQEDPEKPTIFLTSAILLILDNAATTQEAVDLAMGVNSTPTSTTICSYATHRAIPGPSKSSITARTPHPPTS